MKGTPDAVVLSAPMPAHAVGSQPDELIVLKAHGKRNRMAKTLSLSAGQHVVGDHDGRSVFLLSHARTEKIGNVLDAARALARVAGDEFIIRGALVAGLPPRFRRLLHPKLGVPATIVAVPRSYVALDIDGVSNLLPWYEPGVSDHEDATSAVEELVRDLLTTEFHGVSCWFGFTGSHGVKQGMRLRLFYCLARPLDTPELKAWLGHLCRRGVDTSVFSPAQQVLVAPPNLAAGVHDPVRVRSGLVTGARHVVVPPAAMTLRVMAGQQLGSNRAASQAGKTAGAGQTAVRSGGRRTSGGYLNALARIGDGPDQDGLHAPILSTVGAWVRLNGPGADPATLIEDITKHLATAVLDLTKRSPTYVSDQLASLPSLVADVCQMERQRMASDAAIHEQRVRVAVAAPRPLVSTTVDEAAQSVRDAVRAFITVIPKLIERRNATWRLSQERYFGRDYPATGSVPWRSRGAVVVDVGVGKTEAVISEVVAVMELQP